MPFSKRNVKGRLRACIFSDSPSRFSQDLVLAGKSVSYPTGIYTEFTQVSDSTRKLPVRCLPHDSGFPGPAEHTRAKLHSQWAEESPEFLGSPASLELP